ncbi:MAG TPA: hypothetical protein VF715_05020 [Thermoleophilaceae bacterium]|jgi:GTP cyclohydrolase II
MHIAERILDVPLHNDYGEFLAAAYRTRSGDVSEEHLLLYRSLEVRPLPVRVNSACFTSDIFGCRRCDCRWQLQFAMRYIARAGAGLIIYHLAHEGRANGLVAKLRAQDAGAREGLRSKLAYEVLGFPADPRRYEATAAILHDLNVREIALMSNSPHKRRCLEDLGINVATTISVRSPDATLEDLYAWKRQDFGHDV